MRHLVVSDIHSNLAAFDAVLADAGQFDTIWCMGDVVGYGPQPNQCIDRLRSFPHVCVAGNHDWAVIDRLDISAFNHDALQACLWTRDQLTTQNREFIETLDELLVEDGFTLVHGSLRHPIWEYITHCSVALASFDILKTSYCLFGHTHIPIVYVGSARGTTCEAVQPTAGESVALGEDNLLINPGAVGQPRDADPRASYAMLDLDARTLEYRRVEYPIEETQRLMLDRGLPSRLAHRLSIGW